MQIRLRALAATLAVAGLGCSLPMSAHALGFGTMRVLSEVGSPLRAEVELKLTDRETSEDVKVRPAATAEYERQGVPFQGILEGLRVQLETRGKRAVAVITTLAPVQEPVLHFVLQSDSVQGRMVRAFTLAMPTTALQGPSAQEGATGSRAVTALDVLGRPKVAAQGQGDAGLGEGADRMFFDAVIEVGQRPPLRQLKRIKTSGTQVPLTKALFQVVPTGWRGYAGDATVKQAPPVDWKGGDRFWLVVLNDLMTSAKLTATVDWNTREVTFRSLDAVDRPLIKTEPAPVPVTSVAQQPAKAVANDPNTEVAAQTLARDEAVARAQPESWQAKRLAQVQADQQLAAAAPVGAAPVVAAAPTQPAATPAPVPAPASGNASLDVHNEFAAETLKRDTEVARTQPGSWQARRLAQVQGDQRLAAAVPAVPAPVAAAVPLQPVAAPAPAPGNASLDAHNEFAAETLKRDTDVARTQPESWQAQRAKVVAQDAQLQAPPAPVAEPAVPAVPAAEAAPAAAEPVIVKAPAPGSLAHVEIRTGRDGGAVTDAAGVKSAGYNVPVAVAMQRIVPEGWTLVQQESLSVDAPGLAWRGQGRHWLAVLDEALAPTGLHAVVDGARQQVTLRRKS